MDHRALAVCRISFPVLVIGGCKYMQEEAANKGIVAHAMSEEEHIYGSSYKPAGGEVSYDIVIETKCLLDNMHDNLARESAEETILIRWVEHTVFRG